MNLANVNNGRTVALAIVAWTSTVRANGRAVIVATGACAMLIAPTTVQLRAMAENSNWLEHLVLQGRFLWDSSLVGALVVLVFFKFLAVLSDCHNIVLEIGCITVRLIHVRVRANWTTDQCRIGGFLSAHQVFAISVLLRHDLSWDECCFQTFVLVQEVFL